MDENPTTTEPTTKKQKSKPKMKFNKWMIGLIVLVLVLGGVGLYQFKKNKDKKAETEAKDIKDNKPFPLDGVEDSVKSPTATPDRTQQNSNNDITPME